MFVVKIRSLACICINKQVQLRANSRPSFSLSRFNALLKRGDALTWAGSEELGN